MHRGYLRYGRLPKIGLVVILLVCLLVAYSIGQAGAQAPALSMGFTADGLPYQGDPNAPVVVAEYASYQCPFCARHAREVLPKLRDQYVKTGKVLYVFVSFPLADWSLDAQAAACAGNQGSGAFWSMHDLLFSEQANWSGQNDVVDRFKAYATRLNLDRKTFDACLDSGQFAKAIADQKDQAVRRGVRGTPTFFIKDRPLVGFVSIETLASLIEAALGQPTATVTPTETPTAPPVSGTPGKVAAGTPGPATTSGPGGGLSPGADLVAQQVIELTNQERVRAGLPPLKANPLLAQAASAHTSAMADRGFMDHQDPTTRTMPGDRVRSAGFDWTTVGENVAAGAPTPAEVVAGWMASPGHRANILSVDFNEIGVGYTFRTNDTYACGSQSCHHYWTQNFGTRKNTYPLIINNEAISTTTTSVSLYVYGQGWAKEMRLRNDNGAFTAWEPFSSTRFWQLANVEGERRVTVELRNGQAVVTSSDTIQLMHAIAPTGGDLIQPGDLNIERQVDPLQLSLNDELTVHLTLASNLDSCGPLLSRMPAEIMLVIDRSGSMGDPLGLLFGGMKLAGAREAAKVFIDQVDPKLDLVGVVQFDGQAGLLQPLSSSSEAIKAAIDTLTATDGTSIAAGLKAGYIELAGPHHRSNATRAIVLLSDGQSDRNEALREAKTAKDAGMRVVTIGLGPDADRGLLGDLASSPNDFYYAPETAQLADIYRSIAQTIREYAPISGLALKHSFDAGSFEIVPGSVDPPAQVTANTILWKFDRLDKVPRTFSYRLVARRPGAHNVDRGDEVTFTRCEQSPGGASLGPGLRVQVLQPTPTPTPTNTPTLTPTPSPTSSVTPTWTPFPLTPPVPPTLRSLVCSEFPWWLLLALLFILLFLGLVWARDVAGLRRWLTEGRRRPRWCQLIGLLVMAYLLFLLALALSQFRPLACQPREAIYFWRADSSNRSIVMVKPTKPDLPPYPMREINRASNCVACHTVSRSTRNARIAAVTDNGTGPIQVMGLDGKPISVPFINGSYLSWSPDGTRLAYSANDKDIYILDVAAETAKLLVGASDPNVIETMPAWSADGLTIAFVRSIGATNGYKIDAPSDIYVVPAGGGIPMLLAGASGNGFNYYPAYSPDGRWLAFTRHIQGTTTYADPNAEIFIVPATGGAPRRLPANDGPQGQALSGVSNSWPTWSLDSSLLAFSSKRYGGQYDILITHVDSSGNSGPAQPLAGVNDPQSFEHLAYWGVPPAPDILGNLVGLWPWLLPIPLLALLAWLLCRPVPPPKPLPHTLHLERKVSPGSGRVGRDEFTVTLRLIGDIAPCHAVREHKPLDIALVMDVSTSMANELGQNQTGNKLDGAKRAARTFVDQLDLSLDQVALVCFSDAAQVTLPLTNDGSQIKHAIDGLKVVGGTQIHAGLTAALQALSGPNRRPEAEAAIVLLSDGQSEPAPAQEVAIKARDAGIRVITIGLGSDAAQGLLRDIASQPMDYHYSPDADGLTEIYRQIAITIRQPIAATDLEFEHTYDATNFDLIPESVFPIATQGGGVLIWRLEHVGTVMRSFRYRLRPRTAGTFDVDRGDQIHYLACGQEPKTLREGPGLPVTVREPVVPSGLRAPKRKQAPEPLSVRSPSPLWQPDRALIIGIGGTGRWVLTHLKKNLRDAGAGRLPEQVKLLVLDTSEYELLNDQRVPVEFAGAQIEPQDVLVLDKNLRSLIEQISTVQQTEPELDELATTPFAEFASWFPAADYRGLSDPQKDLGQGTHGRRPLARAGLVDDLGKGTGKDNSSRLWQFLSSTIPVIKGDRDIRIILVGSLAGGMSGTFFDVAYLARRAVRILCGEEFGLIMEGYLALNSAFDGLMADQTVLGANTGGALRELRRFQLNPGFPYPMHYKTTDDDPVLAGACGERLLTDVYLFGSRLLAAGDPHTTTFPAMADLITVRLDRASESAGAADWHQDMRNAVEAYRKDRHELAVGSAGSFVYRLPVYDLMQQVMIRWARSLVQTFLIGEGGGSIRLDSSFARDPGLAWTPAELVPVFLQGWLRSEPADRGLGSAAALACLITKQVDEQLESGLRDADRQGLDKARLAFEDELTYTLALILNGTEEAAANQPHLSRLAYAVEFLNALAMDLDDVMPAVAKLIQDTGTDVERRRQAEALEVVRGVYRSAVEVFKSNLRQVAAAVHQGILPGAGEQLGLYELLEKRAHQQQEWRRQMDAVGVRQYIWTLREPTGIGQYTERELVDLWYADYAQDTASPEKYVQYLNWEVQRDGQLALILKVKRDGQSSQVALRTTADLPVFTQAVIDMAGSVLRRAWQEAPSLDRVMNSYDWLSSRSTETAANLREGAAPVLTTDFTGSGRAPRRAVLGATTAFHEQAAQVRAYLAARGVDKDGQPFEPLASLETTDRFACQLIRTVDALSLPAITRLTEGMNNVQERYLKDREQRVVFPAEVEAQQWERYRRIEDDGLGRLVLHPLVVAGFDNPTRSRLYALALASGFVLVEGQSVILKMPDRSREILLRTAPGGAAPLVSGLLAFVHLADSDVVKDVATILNEPAPAIIRRWRQSWYGGMPESYKGPADLEHLGIWTRLVVRHELAERFRKAGAPRHPATPTA